MTHAAQTQIDTSDAAAIREECPYVVRDWDGKETRFSDWIDVILYAKLHDLPIWFEHGGRRQIVRIAGTRK